MIEAMVAGADCIDDVDVLRAGSTAQILGHPVAAPSTIGTFLRGFTFGHVRQLDRFAEAALRAVAPPDPEPPSDDPSELEQEDSGGEGSGGEKSTPVQGP